MRIDSEVTIQEATLDDLSLIQQIARQTWPATFSAILTKSQIAYMLQWMYSTEALTNQISENRNRFFIATFQQKAVGFMSIEHNYQNSSSTKIHKAYILPQMQGQGIGHAFFDLAAAQASHYGDHSILLNVNKYNHQAIAFYERYGMSNVKSEIIDIGNGFVMDDFVFEKKIE